MPTRLVSPSPMVVQICTTTSCTPIPTRASWLAATLLRAWKRSTIRFTSRLATHWSILALPRAMAWWPTTSCGRILALSSRFPARPRPISGAITICFTVASRAKPRSGRGGAPPTPICPRGRRARASTATACHRIRSSSISMARTMCSAARVPPKVTGLTITSRQRPTRR